MPILSRALGLLSFWVVALSWWGASVGFGQLSGLEDLKPNAPVKPLIRLGLDNANPLAGPKKAARPVRVELKPTKGTVADLKPGQEVSLSITVDVPNGSYVYSTTSPGGAKTQASITKAQGLVAVDEDFQPDRAPKTEFEPVFNANVEKYLAPVTWTRRYRLADDATANDVVVQGTLKAQICNDKVCRPFTETINVSLVPAGNVWLHEEQPPIGNDPGPAKITVSLSPKTAKPGEKVTLAIQMALEEGWHSYSITQKPGQAAQATSIHLDNPKNLKPLGEGFQPDPLFHVKTLELGGQKAVQEIHEGTVTWSREFEVLPAAQAEGFGLAGKLKYQICDAFKCVPKTVSFTLGTQTAIATAAMEPETRTINLDNVASTSRDVKQQGLVFFLISAASFGFLALLTPCVFPMVPITISFFLKQAEKEHHRPATLALVYCGGIIATFTGLGLLMAALFEATALNQLANNTWLNLGLAAVIIFFGVSMLGVFEITVPSWILTWSAGKERQGGILGTLFMALTFTLVSFTCTFAFAGLLLVMASKGEVLWPVLGMLAFSAAFALPFFLLALFPSFLKKLPKSGGWMNTVKVTMGFIEIGAALKFLSVADTSWFGQPVYLTYNVIMISWLVIAVLIAGYLLGLFRFPHDVKAKLSWPRAAFAVPFLLLAWLMGVGTFTEFHPRGFTRTIWQNVVAFAPIQPGEAGFDQSLGPWRKSHGLVYALDFEQAVRHARGTGQPLLLDFTGVNCVNCRKMEGMLGDSPQRNRLNQFVRVQLYTDLLPNADESGKPIIEDPKRVEALLEMNRSLQTQWFGDATLPAYAVVHPDDLEVLQKYTIETMAEDVFWEFIDNGLTKWQTYSPEDSLQSTAQEAEPARDSTFSLTDRR